MAKKSKQKSKPDRKPKLQAPKLPAKLFLARMNGAKDKLFVAKQDAIRYVEKKTKEFSLFGCRVVEFDTDGKIISALRLDTKMQSTTAWSTDNDHW